MDGLVYGLCCMFFLIFGGPMIASIIEQIEKSAKERARKKAEEEDARFQREHPEAWRAKELVKLERERLEVQKQLANQYQKQENTRRNVGLIAGIVRGLFG